MTRSLRSACLAGLVALALLAPASPATAAPEGTLTWAPYEDLTVKKK